jgi:hypothetical protein
VVNGAATGAIDDEPGCHHVNQMTRHRLARPRGGVVALLAVAALWPAAIGAARSRIPYAPLPHDERLSWHAWPVPHIAYAALPADERLAPDDLSSDSSETEAPTRAETAAAETRVAEWRPVQDYRPDPAIWRIRDHDTVIYLFGTIHVLPPGFRWRSAALDHVVAAADTLMVESVDDRSAADALGAKATARALPPIARRVSPSHRAALAHFTAGLPPPAVKLLDGLPTWIVAVSVGFVREYRVGAVPGPGADDWLEQRFHAAGKPVVPIEDGEKVMAAVGAVPEAEQRRMLDAALDAPLPTLVGLRAPAHAWAKGEVGPGSALSVDLRSSSGTSALDGPLMADRNHAWAATLAARLKQRHGTILFAAGAGHFIGTGSVIELLRQHGIRVTRIR